MAGRPLLSSARKAVLLAGVAHLLAVSFAQTSEITCFGISGRGYTNNTRCPGSNACCGATATCLSNRLCHNAGDPPDLWIRGPCAVEGWDGMCGEICLYNETEQGGGRFPRVTPCENGSLCCNNDPGCCSNGRGIFLDESGDIVSSHVTAATTSYPPVNGTGPARFTETPSTSKSSSTSASSSTTQTSTSSSTATSTAATSTAATSTAATSTAATSTAATSTAATSTAATSTAATSTTTTSTAATSTAASSSSTSSSTSIPISELKDASASGSDVGLKVGLGLGIPLAALLAGGLVYWFLRWRRKEDSVSSTGRGQDWSSGDGGTRTYAAAYSRGTPEYMSAGGEPAKYIYTGSAPLVEMGDARPSELDTAPRPRHELG